MAAAAAAAVPLRCWGSGSLMSLPSPNFYCCRLINYFSPSLWCFCFSRFQLTFLVVYSVFLSQLLFVRKREEQSLYHSHHFFSLLSMKYLFSWVVSIWNKAGDFNLNYLKVIIVYRWCLRAFPCLISISPHAHVLLVHDVSLCFSLGYS